MQFNILQCKTSWIMNCKDSDQPDQDPHCLQGRLNVGFVSMASVTFETVQALVKNVTKK